MLEPRILAALAASILLSVSAACTPDGTEPGDGEAGSAAKGGSGARAGSGGKGSAGQLADAGAGGAGDAAVSGGRGGTGGRGGSGGSGAGGAAAGSGGPDLSGELFDQDTLVRFDITLPAASITALNANPEVYTHAGLKFGDTTFADVAVRIKGESSRRTLQQKAAFKLKLDEYVANQNLLGLKRITLNNMLSDETYMAECLAYTAWRAAALPAPRCNHAIVYVNDEYYGVYANVESEDKTFLKRWFTSNDGNLYEDGMSDFIDGQESSFELQTNETANNRSDLTALIAAIDGASSATYLADLGDILDTEHFLRYSAMEAAVNQWDGYSLTYFEPNNYRIYHDPTSAKFTFLPWGHDLSMKGFKYVDADAPAREYIPLFTRPLYENKTAARDAGGRIFVGDRAGDRATGGCLSSDSCRSQFAAAVREVIAVYDGANLRALAEKTYAQIESYVEEEPSGRREISFDDFQQAYATLRTHIAGRTQAMRDDLTAAGFTP
jgi:hypothetical protein